MHSKETAGILRLFSKILQQKGPVVSATTEDGNVDDDDDDDIISYKPKRRRTLDLSDSEDDTIHETHDTVQKTDKSKYD